jgi:hypothetical protein
MTNLRSKVNSMTDYKRGCVRRIMDSEADKADKAGEIGPHNPNHSCRYRPYRCPSQRAAT